MEEQPPPPQLPELPLFSCREAYVYKVPPASTAGHRAELWDVNKWLATVKISVVQQDEDAFVRLLDSQSGGSAGGAAVRERPLHNGNIVPPRWPPTAHATALPPACTQASCLPSAPCRRTSRCRQRWRAWWTRRATACCVSSTARRSAMRSSVRNRLLLRYVCCTVGYLQAACLLLGSCVCMCVRVLSRAAGLPPPSCTHRLWPVQA